MRWLKLFFHCLGEGAWMRFVLEKGVVGGAESIPKYSWANGPHVTKSAGDTSDMTLANSLKKVIMFHQIFLLFSHLLPLILIYLPTSFMCDFLIILFSYLLMWNVSLAHYPIKVWPHLVFKGFNSHQPYHQQSVT